MWWVCAWVDDDVAEFGLIGGVVYVIDFAGGQVILLLSILIGVIDGCLGWYRGNEYFSVKIVILCGFGLVKCRVWNW